MGALIRFGSGAERPNVFELQSARVIFAVVPVVIVVSREILSVVGLNAIN